MLIAFFDSLRTCPQVDIKVWGNPRPQHWFVLTSSQAGSSLLQLKISELRSFSPPIGMGITGREDWRDQHNWGEWEETSEHVTRFSPTIRGLITIRFYSLKMFVLLQVRLGDWRGVVSVVSVGRFVRCKVLPGPTVTCYWATLQPGYHWLEYNQPRGNIRNISQDSPQPAGNYNNVITRINTRIKFKKQNKSTCLLPKIRPKR